MANETYTLILSDFGTSVPAADSVTTTTIAAGAVTFAKMAANSVGTAAIIDANVTLAKIAPSAAYTLLGNPTGTSVAPSAITSTAFMVGAAGFLSMSTQATARNYLGFVAGVLPVTLGGTGATATTFCSLTTNVSGTLPIANGGTGSTSTTFCSLTTNVSGTLPIANGGTGSASTTFCSLTSNVTGTLPIANGGTGKTALPRGGCYGAYYGAARTLAIATGGVYQILTLGVAPTLQATFSSGMSLGTDNALALKNTSGATATLLVSVAVEVDAATNLDTFGLKLYTGVSGALVEAVGGEARAAVDTASKSVILTSTWVASVANNSEVAAYITDVTSARTVNIQSVRMTAISLP